MNTRSMSWSQAGDIHQCQKMWYHKYVLCDVPDSLNMAMALGTLVHTAAENFFISGLSKQNSNVTKRLDIAARHAWDNRPSNPLFNWGDDHRRKLKLAMYSLEEMFKLKKLEVGRMSLERKMRMGFKKNWTLVGVADMVALEGKNLVLTDFKTGRLKQRHDAPVEQVALYGWMWDQIDGNRPVDKLSIAYLGVPWQRYKWDEFKFIQKQSVKKIDLAVSVAQGILDGDEAEPSVSALCGWCPAVDKCEPGAEYVTKRIAQGKSVSDQAVQLLSERKED